MYEVKAYHHDKDWRKGDLEDKFELISSEIFKTRTAAKHWIESRLRSHLGGNGTIIRDYHRGDTPSYCYYYTGYKWVHENSGETMEEYYKYVLRKTKLK